jgi:hypothetical protein
MQPNNALERTVNHRGPRLAASGRGTAVVAGRSARSLGVTSPVVDACVIAGPVLSDVGSAISHFSLLPGARYDDIRSMPLRGNSVGELGAPRCYACVLVQGVPVSRCRQWNGQRLLPYSIVHGDGPDQRLSKCRGQWQPNAPAILPLVRDAALQRGRSAASSDLRPRRHFRRSESRQSCDDDLDIVCAPLGLHRRGVAASGEATTASGVMSDA